MLKKPRRRLKKSIKRFIFANMGILLGVVCAFRVNAEAPLTSVTIDEGTISVEDYAYFKYDTILSVDMPSSLQQVGFSAFEGCKKLKNVVLPEGIRVIDNRAFAKCSSIKELVVPENTAFIGNAAFYGCEAMEKITLPSTLKEISNNLFYGCVSLKDVKIPDGVTVIGQQSFYNCTNLTTLELPDGVTRIDDGAFYDCKGMTTMFLPDSVLYIGVDAFTGCDNLTLTCNPGSYAENYAKTYNMNKKKNSIPSDTTTSESKVVENPDVPATGVDTPYMAVTMMVIVACVMMIVLRRDKLSKTNYCT